MRIGNHSISNSLTSRNPVETPGGDGSILRWKRQRTSYRGTRGLLFPDPRIRSDLAPWLYSGLLQSKPQSITYRVPQGENLLSMSARLRTHSHHCAN